MDEAIRLPQIMVVDDDQDTVAILAHHLQREGFVPIQANSGAQCLKLVHENEVDVILLDLMMPDMDGFQVVKALRDDPETAENPHHHDYRARRHGCAGRGDAPGGQRLPRQASIPPPLASASAHSSR